MADPDPAEDLQVQQRAGSIDMRFDAVEVLEHVRERAKGRPSHQQHAVREEAIEGRRVGAIREHLGVREEALRGVVAS